MVTLVIVLSGPLYLYTLDLQFIPREQWLIHLLTLDPLVLAVYIGGGPLFTTVCVFMRYLLIDYCNDRLTPGRI